MLNFFQFCGLLFSQSLFPVYMDWFHNFTCGLLFGVLFFVGVVFFYLYFNTYFYKSDKAEYQWGEFFCSIFPTMILVIQMVPSLSLLYYYGLMNLDASMTIKVVGHQWYWSYEYGDLGVSFDSYMKSIDQLEVGESRLLEVDNRCCLPCDINLRFCITSSDVIHSWALPSLAIKLDAMSGIMSTLFYNFPIVGVFYGQCSEICGANHTFMPIVVESVLMSSFKSWASSW